MTGPSMETTDRIAFAVIAIIMGTVMGMIVLQCYWLDRHIAEWKHQNARFAEAHEAGRHEEAVRIYEAEHDAPRSPYDVRLHRKYDHQNFVAAAQSYQRVGQDRKARRLYLRTIGWTETQFAAYCALNQDCDARALATGKN